MGKKKNKFLICFVLDETGSMQIVKQVTINGYNEYVNNLCKQKNTNMALVRFDSDAIDIEEPKPIQDATILTSENYQPGAMTPLYDAVGKSIREMEKYVDSREVIFVIMTDGLENASKEYKRDTIFSLVKEKEKAGWKFVYLGANQDAYVEGFELGIHKVGIMNYSQSKTAETFSGMTRSTLRYMTDPDTNADWFNDDEKEQAIGE